MLLVQIIYARFMVYIYHCLHSLGSTSAQAGDLAVRIRKCLSDGEKALPTLEDSNLDEMTPTVSSVRRCSGDILQGVSTTVSLMS